MAEDAEIEKLKAAYNAKLKRLEKWASELRATQAKSYELLEQIEAELKGSPSLNTVAGEVLNVFGEQWRGRYRTPYLFAKSKEIPAVKRLMKTLGRKELEARIVKYLQDGDRFLIENRHPFGLFESRVNRYATTTTDDFTLAAPPSDCRHSPRCTSDQQHTALVQRELRSL
ncbi:MAG TPA: hypothetical protein VK506_16470 [Conexibacter sp.]|nr:hypothetical protein [Conexibacter sp.]